LKLKKIIKEPSYIICLQGLRRHLAAFYGNELVSWLVERGLAQTRQEAEMLGRQLLR
jgi:hypothetical protein